MEFNKFTGKPIGGSDEQQGKPNYEKKGFKKPYNKKQDKTEKPAPVYDDFQKDITNDLMAQVKNYRDAHMAPEGANPSENDIKKAEQALFSLFPAWPFVVNDAEGNAVSEIWQVERSVRTDRVTKDLLRATCSLIVLDYSTRTPTYFVQAFMNKAGGTISVIPMGNKSPNYRNTLRTKISPMYGMGAENHVADEDAITEAAE